MLSSVRRGLSLALLLLAALFAVQIASAQYFGRNKVQYDQFPFDILPTNHFDLYFYEETTAAARDAARMAGRWYARQSTIFSHELTARRPLIFYANDADFQQTNVIGGAIGEGVGRHGGAQAAGGDAVYGVLQRNRPRARARARPFL